MKNIIKVGISITIGAILCVGGFLLTKDNSKNEIKEKEFNTKDFQQDEYEKPSEIYLDNYNLQNIIDFGDGMEIKQKITKALDKIYDKNKVFGKCTDVRLKTNTDNILEFEITIFKKDKVLGKHKVEVEVTENRVQMFDISDEVK